MNKKETISNIKDYLKSLINDIQKHPLRVLIVVLIYVFLSWLWGGEAAFFLGGFFLFLVFMWESRIFIGLALMFLASCPFFLIFQRTSTSEQMANYAYYFLFLGVVLQLVEYIRETKKEKVNK